VAGAAHSGYSFRELGAVDESRGEGSGITGLYVSGHRRQCAIQRAQHDLYDVAVVPVRVRAEVHAYKTIG
jgi:hypothetical protein